MHPEMRRRRSQEFEAPSLPLPVQPFERATCLAHIGRGLAGLFGKSPFCRNDEELAAWLVEYGEYHRAPMPFDGDIKVDRIVLDKVRTREAGEAILARAARSRARTSPLQRRLDWIGDTLALAPADRAVLSFAVRVALYPALHEFAALVVRHGLSGQEINQTAVKAVLDLGDKAARRCLSSGSPLRALGLLDDAGGCDVTVSQAVLRLVGEDTVDPERLRNVLLGTAEPSPLGWTDFDALGGERDLALSLVKTAFRAAGGSRPGGANILFYGAPGTGKTEFAKVLAREAKGRPVLVGEADERGGEPSRNERLAYLALSSRLASAAGRTMLIVDEADDIFTGVDEGNAAARTGSKVFMNRVVEGSTVPTVWITNQPERLGGAVMRRMDLAIRFRSPDRRQRRRVAERIAARERLDLSGPELDRLSIIESAPALVEAGLRVAARIGGDAATAERATLSLARATGTAQPVPQAPRPFGFDVALAHADTDLAELAERVAGAGSRAVSFLLSGPPGTGKSAYAAHLAERMGVEVVERRASDLMSMYVGGTEKAIAEAFEDARETGRMLLIDEADSMLRAREGAHRSWEVSQVNEMLTWMERHPLPFAMTTNAPDALDPAALRRFVFKIGFRPMRRDQIAAAFERAFGQPASADVLALDLLTPGDIAVVARRAELLDETEIRTIASWIVDECERKPGGGRGRLGFAPYGAS